MKKSLIIASIFAAAAFAASIFVSAEEEKVPLTDSEVSVEQPVAFESEAASETLTTIDTVDASFESMDANQDGVISLEEAETNEMLISAFAELDQDQTKDLSKAEFTEFAALSK